MATIDVRHRFVYVRGNEREVVLRLLEDGLVSYDWKTPHGSWSYSWDDAVRKGVFTIRFNWNPEKEVKEHVFVQIADTDAYRSCATQVAWTAMIIASK